MGVSLLPASWSPKASCSLLSASCSLLVTMRPGLSFLLLCAAILILVIFVCRTEARDSDADGIDDSIDLDYDNDGIPDVDDLDDDNDGIPDTEDDDWHGEL